MMLLRQIKLLLTLVLLMTISILSEAQILTDQSLTIEQYVNDFLLGDGVTATNITYTGSEEQIGTVGGLEGSIFPISSGLVLSTAHIGTDPSNPFQNEAITVGAVDGDPDLLTIANSVPGMIGQTFTVSAANDVAILEFDFVPNGDTLKFNYVFGSDEYNDFENTTWNDIFAFFLSGPGLTGPYASPAGFPNGAVNIAQVPNSVPPLPITVSSVNNLLNTEYYIDNPTGGGDISLKGFTDSLTAVSPVQCGETYHIKIAIADGSDHWLESIVVLEEGSFSSDQAIQTELVLNIGTSTNILYENCGVGTLVFTRFGDLDEAATVELVTSGVATNGVDFTFIPSEVYFAPGDSITSFDVTAMADGITEGIESVTIDVTNTAISACGVNVTTQFTFDVYDDPEALALEGGDFSIECGDSVLIGGLVTGGYGVYTYNWSGNASSLPLVQDSTFYAMPGVTTEYILQVDDICNAGSISATYNVTVPVYPALEVDIDPSIDLVCLDVVDIAVNSATGGYGDYTFAWFQDTLIGTGTNISYTAYNTTQIMVVMTDECGLTASDVMQVNVPPVPIIIDMSADQNICRGDVVQVSGDVSGGKPPYVYQWNTSVLNTDELTVNPIQTQVYELTITDQCFASESNTTTVEVSEVTALFTLSELDYYGVDLKNHTHADNGGLMSYLWDLGDGSSSTDFELTYMYNDLDDHIISLTAISELGCRDSVAFLIEAPKPVFVPSSFSPNGDGINDLFFATGNDLEEFDISVYDRWGRIVFQSNDIEEKWNGRGTNNENYYTTSDVYN